MKKVVLIRHGESVWNKENRFTGWTDVDLTRKGVEEAKQAGLILMQHGFIFDTAYTSYLKRAIHTLNIVLEVMEQEWLPVEKSWRLNEKHYGALQGLNKQETALKYGEEQVQAWRRSYTTASPPLMSDDPRNPFFDIRYNQIPRHELPLTESLQDTLLRSAPYWRDTIFPSMIRNRQLLVVAHGNSLRSIIKLIKQISDADIAHLNIPTGVPHVFEFDEKGNLLNDYYLEAIQV